MWGGKGGGGGCRERCGKKKEKWNLEFNSKCVMYSYGLDVLVDFICT